MSSDNYYQPYELPDGKFVVAMGFASDDGLPHPQPHDPVFDTEFEAISWAVNEYSEYGCYPVQTLSERMWRHYQVRCGNIKVGKDLTGRGTSAPAS
jgi:hypothetical protein